MSEESNSSELHVQNKANQILSALTKIAATASSRNLAELVQDMEVLLLTLPCDSGLLEKAKQIKELYETAVADVEILYATLQEITAKNLELE